MPFSELDVLQNSWVLLDNDVLIKTFQNFEATEFIAFIEKLKNAKITPLITEEIAFEFLSACNTAQELTTRKDFLNSLGIVALPPSDKDIINTAILISDIYHNKKQKGCTAGLTDCVLSAQLKRYGTRLTLLTANLKDFPLVIHDRIGVHPIDIGTAVITLGLIRFNEAKFSDCIKDFGSK